MTFKKVTFDLTDPIDQTTSQTADLGYASNIDRRSILKDPRFIKDLQDRYDIRTVRGMASHPDVLRSAGAEARIIPMAPLLVAARPTPFLCSITGHAATRFSVVNGTHWLW